MSAVAADSLPEGQQEALAALRSFARLSDGALAVDLDYGNWTANLLFASTSHPPVSCPPSRVRTLKTGNPSTS